MAQHLRNLSHPRPWGVPMCFSDTRRGPYDLYWHSQGSLFSCFSCFSWKGWLARAFPAFPVFPDFPTFPVFPVFVFPCFSCFLGKAGWQEVARTHLQITPDISLTGPMSFIDTPGGLYVLYSRSRGPYVLYSHSRGALCALLTFQGGPSEFTSSHNKLPDKCLNNPENSGPTLFWVHCVPQEGGPIGIQ